MIANLFEEQARLERIAREFADTQRRLRWQLLADEERAMQEEQDKRRQYDDSTD